MHRSIKHISTKGTAMVMFLMLVHLQVRAQFDTLPVTDTTATGYESEEVQIFDRISDSSRVQVRTIPDSMVRHLRSDENYWYVNTTPDRQKQKQVTDVHRSAKKSHPAAAWLSCTGSVHDPGNTLPFFSPGCCGLFGHNRAVQGF